MFGKPHKNRKFKKSVHSAVNFSFFFCLQIGPYIDGAQHQFNKKTDELGIDDGSMIAFLMLQMIQTILMVNSISGFQKDYLP